MSHGLHHLHARHRIYKKLEPYPHPKAWKRYFDYLMYGIAIAAPLALVPQVWQVYSSKDVSQFVFITWLLLASMHILWFTYGIIHRTIPIIISSSIFGLLNLSMVAAILMYG